MYLISTIYKSINIYCVLKKRKREVVEILSLRKEHKKKSPFLWELLLLLLLELFSETLTYLLLSVLHIIGADSQLASFADVFMSD